MFIYLFIYMYISIYLYIKFVAVAICARRICDTSALRSIFSFLRASYVCINPCASFNDIPAYHVGILNATKADSRLGRRGPRSAAADQAHL